jgi:hypothetical protein
MTGTVWFSAPLCVKPLRAERYPLTGQTGLGLSLQGDGATRWCALPRQVHAECGPRPLAFLLGEIALHSFGIIMLTGVSSRSSSSRA